jgi:rare lipoprotein A
MKEIAVGCVVALLVGCGAAAPSSSRIGEPDRDLQNERAGDAPAHHDHRLRGEASYYARRFHGRITASGEPFDMYGFTAAHKTLPFHTIVRVTHPPTQKSVVVRINDRGPYVDGRIIDLSWAAAADLGLLDRGVIDVRLEVLRWGDGSRVSN